MHGIADFHNAGRTIILDMTWQPDAIERASSSAKPSSARLDQHPSRTTYGPRIEAVIRAAAIRVSAEIAASTDAFVLKLDRPAPWEPECRPLNASKCMIICDDPEGGIRTAP
jgi:hypothetical protein